MVHTFWRRILGLSVLPVLLTGCFWQSAPPPPPADAAPESPVVRFMINSSPGSTEMFTDPLFGPEVRVTVEAAFTAASGELCKRATVLSLQQDAEIVVVCKNANGEWTLAPRIWGQGLSAR